MRRRFVPGYGFGILLGIAAAICWSLGGVLVRLVHEAGSWHIILYRSLGLAVALTVLIAMVHGWRGWWRSVQAAGVAAVVAGICSTASSVFFILSLGRITVANALFMGGITPFLAAIGAQVFLAERVSRSAMGAMSLAAAGVAVMLGSGLALGQLAGNLLALGSGISFAAHGLVLRARRQTDMLPAVLHAGLGGVVVSLLALGLLGLSPAISVRDLGLTLVMGVVQLGIGMVLYTRASRHLPAAELQLLATSELVMGPLWVWIAVGEAPGAATLAGGVLILLAIVIQARPALERRLLP